MSTEQELPGAERDRAAKEAESELKDSELDDVAGGNLVDQAHFVLDATNRKKGTRPHTGPESRRIGD